MCKQAQECGIPTSGSYLQRHSLIDIELMVYIYIRLGGSKSFCRRIPIVYSS